MQRNDPLQVPWYELDFRMTRWQCPPELPQTLLEDVIEAVQDLDSMLLSAMRLVDRHSYGSDASPKRYIPEAEYEALRIQFELIEDRFLVAQSELRVRWTALTTKHADAISNLTEATKSALVAPDSAYSMGFSVVEVELDDTYKQFLTGIHGDNKPCIAASYMSEQEMTLGTLP